MRRVWDVIRVTTQRQLWRLRCEECFETTRRPIFEKIGVVINTIDGELRTQEALAEAQRDHEARTVLSMFLADLSNDSVNDNYSSPDTAMARLYFGGDSRCNPGEAGAGAVLLTRNDTEWRLAWYGYKYLGSKETNNVAEYEAMIMGLEAAVQLQLTKLEIFGDSQLIVRQLGGRAAVRNKSLDRRFKKARD